MSENDSSSWKLYKVSEFAEVVGGGTPSTGYAENFGEDIPWITPKDLSTHRTRYIARGERSLSARGLAGSSAKRLPPGTVLVSSRAPIGLTAIAQNEVSTNQGCRSLVLKPALANSEFVYYLMSASTDYLHQHANGTTFMELPGGVFKNLEFLLPSLEDQRRIAEVLSGLDDAIEAARSLVRVIETAIELEAGVVLQDAGDEALLLTDVATIVNGYSYKSAELVDESDTAMVNLKNFGRHGGFRLDGLKPFAGSPKPTQRLAPGDAMVAKTDLTQGAEVIGRCLRMPRIPQFTKYVASLDVAIVRTKGTIPQPALVAILSQPEFRDHCLGFVNGTTVLHLSKAALETYSIPALAPEAIASLTSRVEALTAQQDRSLVELHHLVEMRSFLLPRLVSGELRVSVAEEMVGAVFMSWLDEADIELNALDELAALGWNTKFGPDIAKGCADDTKREREEFDQIFLDGRLRAALTKVNPGVEQKMLDEAFLRLRKAESQNLLRENLRVHRLITEGCPVEYVDANGDTRGVRVRYIDFDSPVVNDFVAVNQFALKRSNNSRRMDVIGFVNGIPVAVFELKSPTKRWATTKGAWRQLGTYQREFPELFAPCAIQVIGDGLSASAGTVAAPLQHFAPWKAIDSEDLAPETLTGLQVLIRGMFDKGRLLDLIRNFASFVVEDGQLVRKGAKYHQFWAVNSALESAVRASAGDGRGGIVWHTQGSGKSLEMLFLAGKLMRDPRLKNPTVVLLTDRNDLDDQLFSEVFAPDELLPEKPVQAESADHMRTLLRRPAGGIVFTTIQKFRSTEKGDRHPQLSDRKNIIVIADEAHRSQYDLIDGFARNLRDALPKATFVGFTGTPIDEDDRSTREIFGDCVSVYDLTRAVNDGATVRIYYESRLAKVSLNEDARKALDEGVDEVLETEEDVEARERAKSRWARQVAVVGAAKRVKEIAEDLVAHWEQRSETQVGKAMVVCMSRQICVDLYDQIVKLRPDWHNDDPAKGRIKVVITGAANDPEELLKHAHNRDTLRLLKRRAKKVLTKDEIEGGQDELEIVIVRDMWLTGFDAPVMNTMYVDKPMKGHSLMQAIARVNRTFRDKEGGLIVDYIGIATNLREAVAQYTKDDQDKAGIDTSEFAKVALEKHDIVKGILSPVKWSSNPSQSREERISTLQKLVQHVLSEVERKKRFLIHCRSLLTAFSIAGARDEVRKIIDDVNLFSAIYGQVAKTDRTGDDGEDRDEALDTALKQLVNDAVAADGVIDVFGNLGLPNPELSVLSPEFLDKVRKGDQTNLQFELMKKVLNDKLRDIKQKNIIEARRFSEMLETSILALQNRTITTAQAIQQLLELAEEINKQALRGDQLGLTSDEIAFYDAITQNGSAVLELGDETLRKLTHELVEVVKKNAKLDWTKKETVRAEMRTAVKRLLRKYRYPPDRQESAVSLVIEQAELLAQDLTSQ